VRACCSAETRAKGVVLGRWRWASLIVLVWRRLRGICFIPCD
jgi:hypothetical protein